MSRLLILHCLFIHTLSAEFTGNMIVNPGFEEDFVNLRGEPHVLSFKGDWFYNQQDEIPDFWTLQGSWIWKEDTPHSGKRSLELTKGAVASRQYPVAISQDGGGPWGGVNNLNMKAQNADRFPRNLRASAWCRGGGKLLLTTNAIGKDGKGVSSRVEAALPEGAEGWQRIEATLDAGAQQPGLITNISISLTGPGEFDDVELSEDVSGSPNLAQNVSFEDVDDNDYPKGWSGQRKYSWMGPTYYVWTDWNHFHSRNRGGVVSDALVSHSGKRSLRFNVFPGDEKYVESDAIILNQTKPQVIEIGVMVRADRIKLIDLRAINELGDDLQTARPRQPEYGTGGTHLYGAGTFGWRYIRKFVSPINDQPIKSIRIRLCARGFNAHTLDDGGTRPFCVQTGTVWWDDLRVIERESNAQELAARGVKTSIEKIEPNDFTVESVDLGDRLFGENELRIKLRSSSKKTMQLRVGYTFGQEEKPVKEEKVKIKNGEATEVVLPYKIEKLAGDTLEQQPIHVMLYDGGKLLAKSTYYFNTWPVAVDFDFSKHYSYPDENPLRVAMNLGIASGTLAKVARLELLAKNNIDAAVVGRHEIKDLAAAFKSTKEGLPKSREASYEHKYPTPFWWSDRTNLLAVDFDISKLKVWPQDQPTRDTCLELIAYDSKGSVLFSGKSQAFGRMERFDRKQLPEIETVKVREDGAVLINGQPKFLSGATHQQQRIAHSPEIIADLGFLGHRLASASFEDLDKMWTEHRIYLLQAKPVSKADTTVVHTSFTDEQRKEFTEWIGKGGGKHIVSFNTGGWESKVDHTNAEVIKSHIALNDEIRKSSGRPIAWSPSGAYNAWWVNEVPYYDIVHGETEMWGAMDYNVVWTPYQKSRPTPSTWVYLPQLYENHPFERLRFETYENILRGSAGYSMIQGIGDPTFLRGLNGELRYLESRWYSQETPPAVAVTPEISSQVRKKGNKAYIVATNSGPVQVGVWDWHEEAFSGKRSHSGDSINSTWKPEGWTLHGWRVDKAREVKAGDRIVQYVRIDPTNVPKSITLGIRGNGKFIHNVTLGDFSFKEFQEEAANLQWYTELNHSTWHAVWCHLTPEKYAKAVRLKGQQWADTYQNYSITHKKHVDEETYKSEHFKSLGKLPEAGKWYRIEVRAEDAGLVGKWVDGFAFSTQKGNALWDHTAILSGDKEIVLCEDSVGIDRSLLGSVRFNIAGLTGTRKVKVLFENREIDCTDGTFTDDFKGIDTYGQEAGGVAGDAFGYIKDEMRELVNIMPSGYAYSYGPTAVHIYEIPLD